MDDGPPDLVVLNHDDYKAKYVGRTADGRQFFLTTPFVSSEPDSPGSEFMARYLFDGAGKLIEARIENLGPREQLDEPRREALRDEMIASLGEVEYGSIQMVPFQLERFGVEFGLIPQAPEEPDEDWWVTVEPGDYMAFYPPWDGGDYDT